MSSIAYGAIITAAVLAVIWWGAMGATVCIVAWFIWVVIDALMVL
jgi:hypothetical protein